VALAVATVLATTVTGCGGDAQAGKEKEKKPGESYSKAADLTTCKADAQDAAKPYPKGFPADWPFPPETVVFNAQDQGAAGTVVSAISSSDFRSILDFMNKDVVGAGFTIEKGETEEHDAEAEWEGNGFRGRWAIRESAKCPGETVVQVLSAAE
jgi:hypothetical protein